MSARGRIPSTVLKAYEHRGSTPVAPAVIAMPLVEAGVEAEAKPKRRTRKKATAQS